MRINGTDVASALSRCQGQSVAYAGRADAEVDTALALTHHAGRYDMDSETFVAHTLRGEGFDASEDGTGRGSPLVFDDPRRFDARGIHRSGGGTDLHPPLNTVAGQQITSGLRRLTPLEWERLQGFPDGHTLVPYRGKPAADGPRYRAIGNSMAVPVIAWIGERIEAVESTC